MIHLVKAPNLIALSIKTLIKSKYLNMVFSRYSSIVPIFDFRVNYEKGYVDQFYGEE